MLIVISYIVMCSLTILESPFFATKYCVTGSLFDFAVITIKFPPTVLDCTLDDLFQFISMYGNSSDNDGQLTLAQS